MQTRATPLIAELLSAITLKLLHPTQAPTSKDRMLLLWQVDWHRLHEESSVCLHSAGYTLCIEIQRGKLLFGSAGVVMNQLMHDTQLMDAIVLYQM